ncbi:hypothetical protein ACFQX7_15880 [Luedemannella flava]
MAAARPGDVHVADLARHAAGAPPSPYANPATTHVYPQPAYGQPTTGQPAYGQPYGQTGYGQSGYPTPGRR